MPVTIYIVLCDISEIVKICLINNEKYIEIYTNILIIKRKSIMVENGKASFVEKCIDVYSCGQKASHFPFGISLKLTYL